MNTLDSSKGCEEAGGRMAGLVKAAAVGLLMVGAVVVGSGMNRHEAVAADAAPVLSPEEAFRAGYFPAQFPAPEGAPAAHVEAF